MFIFDGCHILIKPCPCLCCLQLVSSSVDTTHLLDTSPLNPDCLASLTFVWYLDKTTISSHISLVLLVGVQDIDALFEAILAIGDIYHDMNSFLVGGLEH